MPIKVNNLAILKYFLILTYEKVKMIYIDVLYNTKNKSFVCNDNRKHTIKKFQNLMHIIAEKAKPILNLTSSKKNNHNSWFTFLLSIHDYILLNNYYKQTKLISFKLMIIKWFNFDF